MHAIWVTEMRRPIFALTLSLSACSAQSEQWEGWVYPDKDNLAQSVDIGTYKSLTECRVSALELLTKLSSIDAGDYECGLNCKPLFENVEDSVHVCEQTQGLTPTHNQEE